ncbi:MAG TPA: Re/Si-specific NAD(P)(+) transhydrogenase subunit alpha [Gemmatimonadales bacterium]|nr:Re/Si-specific NAD(P)(+) transhydrogenase subunit alpha [Gemmatimonadales bacterium]
MRIGVPQETVPGERRVALAPDAVKKLAAPGVEVVIQKGAGLAASFSDAAYEAAGAKIVSDARAALDADVVAKVQAPTADEVGALRSGAALIALLAPAKNADLIRRVAERQVNALALELVPRISRAQSMDVLSSQATVAGYKAVLLGAAELGRLLPMLTTAAGTLAPAKAFVLGAGVAGLQAIATARRLGAVVSAFDVRAAVKEQVESLGASFVAAEVASDAAQGAGGYAKELGEEQHRLELAAIAKHIQDVDLVVSTAAIPGKKAPILITEEMVRAMKPGAVIVDLAAETGGNCALTRAGETVRAGGVTILGLLNLPATVPFHASQMFSKNVLTLLQYLIKDGTLVLDPADEITGAMLVAHAGTVRTR